MAVEGPCWLLNIGVLGPEMHHGCEQAARSYAAVYAAQSGGPVPAVDPRSRQCVVLRCATCGTEWEDADGYTGSHFPDTDAALSASWRDGWVVLPDGTTYCGDCSAPAAPEAVPRIPGQMTLDDDTAVDSG